MEGDRTLRSQQDYLTFEEDKHDIGLGDDKVAIPVATPHTKVKPSECPRPSTLRRMFPSLLIICASVLFSGMHTCVRSATNKYDIPFFLVIIARGFFQTILVSGVICLVTFGAVRSSLSSNSAFLLPFRGLFGTLAIIGKFGSLARLPVAVATSLFSTTPIFATTLGWIILGEGMTWIDLLALTISTSGSVLVGMPGKSEGVGEEAIGLQRSHVIGVSFGLLGALASAFTFVTMRRMGERVHFLLSVWSHGLGMFVLPVFITLIDRRDIESTAQFLEGPLISAQNGAYLAILGVFLFSFAASLFQNRGAQLLPAGRVGVLRTFDIPINFLVAYLVLGEFPDSVPQLVGCAMIMMSTILMAYCSMH